MSQILSDTIIPTLKGYVEAKQDQLVSGTNIKTVNSQTLLGSGNVQVGDVSTTAMEEYVESQIGDGSTLDTRLDGFDSSITTLQQTDTNLQSQIDAITSASDVADIVGTYEELQSYDTSKLTTNAIVKVLEDDTHNNASSYYRWTGSTWSYIGSEGPYYTKSEVDSTFVPQTTTVNGQALSSNITLTAANVGAASTSDLAATNANITTLQNGLATETSTRESADTNLQDQIDALDIPTSTSQLTNDSGFITASQAPVQSVNGQTGAVVISSTIAPATTTTLGGIIVGDNLTITEDGTLSANATSITVDDTLSTSSTNPVQNKVITNALNSKLDDTSVIIYSDESVLAATWVSDTTYQAEGYNYKANIPLSGITAQYRPSVTFALSDAESGNFAPISESYAGGVSIYAKTAPTETMTIPSIMCVEEA